MNDSLDRNFKVFLKFVNEAKRDFKKRNYSALKVDLEQARGRMTNLFTLLEEKEENDRLV